MAKNQRTFQDGENQMNGYVINVVRFVGAQQVSETSRIAARHWGTITTPSGEVIDMGESGMTTPQIKKICGGESRTYNRGGQSSAIKQLEKLKTSLESLGMDTTEVDAKITAEKARIEEERNRIDNSAEIKKLEKEQKKLSKMYEMLENLGLSTTEVVAKMQELERQIEALL
jgi:hypothetical protein